MNPLRLLDLTKIFRLAISIITFTFAAASFSVPAFAAMTFSRQPTENVICTGGVCTATAATAVLNVSELANLLGVASLQVSSGDDAQDIVFAVPFRWRSANTLTLEAARSLEIDRPIVDAGPGALTLITNSSGGSSGTLFFGQKGSVSFRSTSNTLTIDGNVYPVSR